jgi:hypothetical protein
MERDGESEEGRDRKSEEIQRVQRDRGSAEGERE